MSGDAALPANSIKSRLSRTGRVRGPSDLCHAPCRLSARGTLSERSTSTSTRGLLRASSHENPSKDNEIAASAANCSANAIQLLGPASLTLTLPARTCSIR